MFKLPIKYLSFDGKERTRDFYFNLTKGDIAEIHVTLPGGLDGFMDQIEEEQNVADVLDVFKKIILKSYGKRTNEGKFIKSKEISEEFYATDAYSELLLMFIDNKDNFVNRFLEQAINAPAGAVKKILAENPKLNRAEDPDIIPLDPVEPVEKVETAEIVDEI